MIALTQWSLGPWVGGYNTARPISFMGEGIEMEDIEERIIEELMKYIRDKDKRDIETYMEHCKANDLYNSIKEEYSDLQDYLDMPDHMGPIDLPGPWWPRP